MHFCISMQYHQYYGLQVIHCRRLSKIQQVLLPHMVSNWGLPAPDCHFSDLQDLLTRAATTAFTTALAMSLHLGVRLAAPKHNRAYFNSIVLQLHIPPDTASTAINPPIPIYFLKKKKKLPNYVLLLQTIPHAHCTAASHGTDDCDCRGVLQWLSFSSAHRSWHQATSCRISAICAYSEPCAQIPTDHHFLVNKLRS